MHAAVLGARGAACGDHAPAGLHPARGRHLRRAERVGGDGHRLLGADHADVHDQEQLPADVPVPDAARESRDARRHHRPAVGSRAYRRHLRGDGGRDGTPAVRPAHLPVDDGRRRLRTDGAVHLPDPHRPGGARAGHRCGPAGGGQSCQRGAARHAGADPAPEPVDAAVRLQRLPRPPVLLGVLGADLRHAQPDADGTGVRDSGRSRTGGADRQQAGHAGRAQAARPYARQPAAWHGGPAVAGGAVTGAGADRALPVRVVAVPGHREA
ncbi:hypothetical protein D3C86_1507130 [compost metagenome]